MFILTASSLGYACALSGRVAEALPLLEQVLEGADRSGFLHDQALAVAWLGEAYLLAGRREETSEGAVRALALARARQERGHEAWALWLHGEIAAQREPPEVEPATAHYRQALTLADELGMRLLQAHCYRGLGALYVQTGCPELARRTDRSHGTVPRYGDDVLDPTGGGHTGAGGGVVRTYGHAVL